MTKAFEDRITESHAHMQQQVQDATSRLLKEKQQEIDTISKEHEWREQQLRQELEFG